MAEAVALGRKIYNNLKKAIRYIVSIHIPIILIVTLPIVLHWKFIDLFSPCTLFFLSFIMGPTCSIIYENEPIDPNAMMLPPRKMRNTFFYCKAIMDKHFAGPANYPWLHGHGVHLYERWRCRHGAYGHLHYAFIQQYFSNICQPLI